MLKVVQYDRRFLDASFKWLSDADFARRVLSPQPTREQQEAWFAALPTRADYLIWGVESDGKPVGAFGLKHIRVEAGRPGAEYWGYFGERSLWGQGLGTFLVDTAFVKARARGLVWLELRVGADNERATRLYKKHGFLLRRGDGAIWEMARDI